MATQLFNENGESQMFEAAEVGRNIEGGWSVTDPTAEPVSAPDEAEEINPVRAAAKEAGIDGWDTKRIKTLEAELSA